MKLLSGEIIKNTKPLRIQRLSADREIKSLFPKLDIAIERSEFKTLNNYNLNLILGRVLNQQYMVLFDAKTNFFVLDVCCSEILKINKRYFLTKKLSLYPTREMTSFLKLLHQEKIYLLVVRQLELQHFFEKVC